MSNLSDLLPAGAGAKSADFVASGTLGSGVTVVLNSNGTVSVVGVSTQSVSSPTTFESATTYFSSATFDSTTNKVVIAYRDAGNSNYGTAIVGTVSGTSISFGTAVVFNTGAGNNYSTTFDSVAGKIVIAYTDEGNSGFGTAKVGTVSGTSISFGTAVVFNSGSTSFISATFDSTENQVVIAYRDAGNSSYGTAIVGTVSGTSISFGAEVVFNSTNTLFISATFDSASSKVVIAYSDINVFYGRVIVATVSSTAISFGSEVTFAASNTQIQQAVYDSVNQKVIICYSDGSDGDKGKAIIGTVSGTTISFGSTITFSSVGISNLSVAYSPSSSSVIAAYRGSGAYGTVISGVASASTITFGASLTFTTNSTSYTASVYDANASKVVVAYSDNDDGTFGKAVVYSPESSNNTSFIGITDQAIADGASGKVVVQGGVSEKVTSLTANTDYYVQSDGSISATVSTVPAGKALSATSILLKG